MSDNGTKCMFLDISCFNSFTSDVKILYHKSDNKLMINGIIASLTQWIFSYGVGQIKIQKAL